MVSEIAAEMVNPIPISRYQFATFRIILGIYLACQFARTVAAELPVTGDEMINGRALVFGLLALASLAFAAGIWRRTLAISLVLGWLGMSEHVRDAVPLTMVFVGYVLMACAVTPSGEGLAVGRRRHRDARVWRFPPVLYWCAWLVMTAGYFMAGCHGIFSGVWLEIMTAVAGPAYSPADPIIVERSHQTWFFPTLIWLRISVGILFVSMSFRKVSRMLAWLAMFGLNLVWVWIAVDPVDAFGLIMIHLFTFDPDWLPARRQVTAIVLYDGVCVLCDRSMKFLIEADVHKVLRYTPLQGETATAMRERHPEISDHLESVVYVRAAGGTVERVYQRSDAFIAILSDMGGFWRIVSWMRVIPRFIRNAVYDRIARNRYGWFGKMDECPVPPPEVREQFLP